MKNETYLIADAEHPLVTTDSVWDEMLLYNIHLQKRETVYGAFYKITAKQINENTLCCELSGGQKVVLMVCLALYSPATRIRFLDLEHALDAEKLQAVKVLIKSSGKQACFGNEA